MSLYLEHYGATDPGKVRKNNEDALLLGGGRDATLFAVADGIGGFEAGEVASGIAIEALKELEPGGSLEATIREANRRILLAARSDDRLSGMGTTVVVARFGASGREPVVEVSHVGDSRAYLFRDGELSPITEDHSLVAELVRSGSLTRAQASEHPQRNLITRALGADEKVAVDNTSVSVRPGDRVLLCSDGLTDMVPEDRVAALMAAASEESPERVVRALLAAALDAGGGDNVTAVVVDVREQADDPPPPPPGGGRDRRTGTQEMRPVSRAEAAAAARAKARMANDFATDPGTRRARRGERERTRGGSERGFRRKPGKPVVKGRRGGGRILGRLAWLVRALATLAVVALLATPFYLWGSTRYYLGYESDEVVIYRGLPYAPFGVELSEEFRRTGLQESEVGEAYRESIRSQRLYEREEAERVVRDLGDNLDRDTNRNADRGTNRDGGGDGGR